MAQLGDGFGGFGISQNIGISPVGKSKSSAVGRSKGQYRLVGFDGNRASGDAGLEGPAMCMDRRVFTDSMIKLCSLWAER